MSRWRLGGEADSEGDDDVVDKEGKAEKKG